MRSQGSDFVLYESFISTPPLWYLKCLFIIIIIIISIILEAPCSDGAHQDPLLHQVIKLFRDKLCEGESRILLLGPSTVESDHLNILVWGLWWTWHDALGAGKHIRLGGLGCGSRRRTSR